MPKFSDASKKKLATCHEDLQTLFNEVIKYYDCTIVEGYRDKFTQDLYYSLGKSKVKYPNGKHNANPSEAVDAVSYESNGTDWSDKQAIYFAGYVKGMADRLYEEGKMKYRIRGGADWNMNNDINDQTFNDYCHFELKK